MTDKKTYEVEIFNQKFSVKSQADENHVNKVADLVNKKIFEIRHKTSSVSSLNVAILAALNIADEYFKLKKESKTKARKMKAEVNEVVKIIDRCLEESKISQ